MQRFLLAAGVLALAVACLTAAPPKGGTLVATPSGESTPSWTPAETPGGLSAPDNRFLGPQSCMATACHGEIPFQATPGLAMRGGEFAFWRQYDPHAGAADTLSTPESIRMLQALGILTDAAPSAAPLDAPSAETRRQIAARCGVCHSPDPPEHQRLDSFVAGQGVSCEACHGAAEQWRDTHYRRAKTNALSDAFLLPGGQVNTAQPHVRAAVCVECHVGSAERQVGHALLAAGHPALQFELASYYGRLPKHWDDRGDRMKHPQLELELWAHGQLAASRAAAAQLADRAAEVRSVRQLDFAEFDCFACHHDLHPQGWPLAPQSTGALRRSDWNTAFAPAALAALGDDPAPLGQLWDRIAIQVAERGRDLTELRTAAQTLQASPTPLTTPRAAPVLNAISAWLPADADAGSTWNWDRAAHAYLALTACYLAGPSDPEIKRELQSLRELLLFPDAYDSPRSFSRYSSPSRSRSAVAADPPPPERMRRVLQQIERLVQLLSR